MECSHQSSDISFDQLGVHTKCTLCPAQVQWYLYTLTAEGGGGPSMGCTDCGIYGPQMTRPLPPLGVKWRGS